MLSTRHVSAIAVARAVPARLSVFAMQRAALANRIAVLNKAVTSRNFMDVLQTWMSACDLGRALPTGFGQALHDAGGSKALGSALIKWRAANQLARSAAFWLREQNAERDSSIPGRTRTRGSIWG